MPGSNDASYGKWGSSTRTAAGDEVIISIDYGSEMDETIMLDVIDHMFVRQTRIKITPDDLINMRNQLDNAIEHYRKTHRTAKEDSA